MSIHRTFLVLGCSGILGVFQPLPVPAAQAAEVPSGSRASSSPGDVGAGEQPEIVQSILIEGTVNVKPSDISARLSTRIGAVLTRETLREDLKEIWALGKFEDATVDVTPIEDGYRVTFIVKERSIIREVRYVGVKALGDKELEEHMPVKNGDFYDPVHVKEGKQKILRAYRNKGYPEVAIRHELIPAEKDQSQMELVITVTEGAKIKVNTISFEGNKTFPAGALKKALKNKEAAFFFQSGLFRKDELEQDKQRLLAFYKNEGYQQAQVLSVEVQPAPKDKPNRVDIKFTLTEGILYYVRSIEFSGATLFQRKELADELRLSAGEKLSQKNLDSGIARIRELYTKRGYIYANVIPEIVFTEAEGKGQADLALRIHEGAVAYLDRILIRGNMETKEKVILREVVIKPGEAFNTERIRKSQERVYNLGFFEDVQVYTEPSLKSGRENLIFEVKERQTGTISLGGGFSSQFGFVGFLQLTKANLFGLGIRISAEWEFGQRRKNISLDYFDPYFLDSPISLGLGFWDTDRDLPNTFTQKSTGGSMEFGHRFWVDWRATVGYKYQVDDVDPLGGLGLPSGVSDVAQRTSSVITTVAWDTRDNIFDPLRGWSHRWFAQVAGGPLPGVGLKFLGGDTKYYKVIYDVSYFKPSPVRPLPLFPRPSLAVHTRLGRGWGFDGQTLPLFDRFFLGGTDSIRGYGERVLGPRELVNGILIPSGGNAMWQFNAEIKWPLVRRVLTLAAPFYDIGNAWRLPLTSSDDKFESRRLAQSVGVGVRLTVPGTIIVIRLDYGWGLTDIYNPPPNGKLHFNIGNIF